MSALRLFPLALLLFTSDIAMVTTLTLSVRSRNLQPTNHRNVARKQCLPLSLGFVEHEGILLPFAELTYIARTRINHS